MRGVANHQRRRENSGALQSLLEERQLVIQQR
jgi:hypothetical protein